MLFILSTNTSEVHYWYILEYTVSQETNITGKSIEMASF